MDKSAKRKKKGRHLDNRSGGKVLGGKDPERERKHEYVLWISINDGLSMISYQRQIISSSSVLFLCPKCFSFIV